ncbi:MAG: DUF3796 domain-containing protein [Candidatus Bathyarchaeota archaeon]|nr:DUF3796 domain-containing protein [Candidatus Termiticorpusculum sp.]
MKTNKIAYLGFIGLTGLLGLHNPYLYTLFNFCILFLFFENDERAKKNIGLSSRNALLYYTIFSTIILIFITITKTYNITPILLILLSQGITIFGVSYAYYNKRGE